MALYSATLENLREPITVEGVRTFVVTPELTYTEILRSKPELLAIFRPFHKASSVSRNGTSGSLT